MVKETIGLEEAVRRTLMERGDIPAAELVTLLEQRYGLKLDVRFLPIIRASLRHKAQREAQRADVNGADLKPASTEADAEDSSLPKRIP